MNYLYLRRELEEIFSYSRTERVAIAVLVTVCNQNYCKRYKLLQGIRLFLFNVFFFFFHEMQYN